MTIRPRPEGMSVEDYISSLSYEEVEEGLADGTLQYTPQARAVMDAALAEMEDVHEGRVQPRPYRDFAHLLTEIDADLAAEDAALKPAAAREEHAPEDRA